jgi:polysaccharide pyruvyl transferase WcaK-like protein
MKIEVHGAGFRNFGAELMLRATVAEIGRRLGDVDFAIDPFYGSIAQRQALHLLSIVPARGHVGSGPWSARFRRQKAFARLRGLLPAGSFRRWCDLYGVVDISDISALLDIAGFAYSEQWGVAPTSHLAALAGHFASRGRPVILLPQAFGPFSTADGEAAFARVLAASTLVYARDRQSYETAARLVRETSRLRLAPDLTISFCATLAEDEGVAVAVLIPNARVPEKAGAVWHGKYEEILASCGRFLAAAGLEVRIDVHDTSGDDAVLASALMAAVGGSAARLEPSPDCVAAKTMLGRARLVISSRYHGLVAALSQAVPVLALGWSHKYEALLRDFDCERFMVSPEDSVESVTDRVEELADPGGNRAVRERLRARIGELRRANDAMWDEVVFTLSSAAAERR